MNCPVCEKEVKVLPDKPGPSTATTFTASEETQPPWVSVIPIVSAEVFKCCNEKCWVTRIEVDWGQS